MRQTECARCRHEILGIGVRGGDGKYIHRPFCPPVTEPYVVQKRDRPIVMRCYVRAFCRQGQHLDCSGVQTSEAHAIVCSCECHTGED
jgi:hypothetical protein